MRGLLVVFCAVAIPSWGVEGIPEWSRVLDDVLKRAESEARPTPFQSRDREGAVSGALGTAPSRSRLSIEVGPMRSNEPRSLSSNQLRSLSSNEPPSLSSNNAVRQ